MKPLSTLAPSSYPVIVVKSRQDFKETGSLASGQCRPELARRQARHPIRGEAWIRLASQIGAGLVGVMYVLDEPLIGLHQRDNERLLNTRRVCAI